MTVTRYRYQAVLTVHAPAHEVAAEVPPTIGVVEPGGAHTCTLRFGSDDLDQLAFWTASFGFGFEIHEPEEPAAHIGGLARRMV